MRPRGSGLSSPSPTSAPFDNRRRRTRRVCTDPWLSDWPTGVGYRKGRWHADARPSPGADQTPNIADEIRVTASSGHTLLSER